MAKGLPTFWRGDLGEAAGAGAVEAERDDRLTRIRIEAGAGIRQAVAGDCDAVFDRIRPAFVVLQHGRRRVRAHCSRDQHMEPHLGGGAEQFAQARRVLRARKLDEHAVGADALDGRLGDADLVDALADDFEALLDGIVDIGGDAGPREADGDGGAVRRDIKIRLAGAEAGADRVGKRLEFGDGSIALRGIGERHDDLVLAADHGLRLDALFAQHAARVLKQRLQPLLGKVGFVDFQNEVRTAAKVEAERHLLMRQPGRHALEDGLRQDVRQGDQ